MTNRTLLEKASAFALWMCALATLALAAWNPLYVLVFAVCAASLWLQQSRERALVPVAVRVRR